MYVRNFNYSVAQNTRAFHTNARPAPEISTRLAEVDFRH